MNQKIARAIAASALVGILAVGLGSAATAQAADGLYGDPGWGAAYWTEQSYDDCAIMAAAHVIGMVTGDMPGEDDIVAVAGSIPSTVRTGHPIYTPDNDDEDNSGTNRLDVPVLLAHYGIKSYYTDVDIADAGGLKTGMPALERYLANDHAAVAIVNANTIWGIPEEGEGSHALIVTGVDTVNGIVHLNDSGIDDGADEQVSIDTFQSTWNDMDQELNITS